MTARKLKGGRGRFGALAILVVVGFGGGEARGEGEGDAARGEALYQSRCFACHALDANRIGPRHRGVYGRKAGSVEGYAYSPALAGLGVTWDAATLDTWLADPRAMAPGTKMGVRVAQAEDRADLIAYLKRESE